MQARPPTSWPAGGVVRGGHLDDGEERLALARRGRRPASRPSADVPEWSSTPDSRASSVDRRRGTASIPPQAPAISTMHVIIRATVLSCAFTFATAAGGVRGRIGLGDDAAAAASKTSDEASERTRVVEGVAKRAESTIVTAYFEIPSKHSSGEYKRWITNMLSLQDAMVIYTTPDMVDTFRGLRKHASTLTHIVPMQLEDTKMATSYSAAFWQAQHRMDPERGSHKDARLYWIWNEKTEFLWRTVDANPFQSAFFAWVDIGYFRSKAYNGQYMIRHIPSSLRKDQVLMLDVSSLIPKRLGKYVGGGFIGGYADGIQQWRTKYFAQLETHKHEFIGKDQPFMWRTCDATPGLCQLVVPKKGHGNRWFYMAPYMMGETQRDANDTHARATRSPRGTRAGEVALARVPV
jgi:hypothetical protein